MTLPASVPPPTDRRSGLDEAAALGIVPAAPGIRSLAFTIDAGIWLLLASPAVVGAVMLALGDTSFVGVLLVIVGIVLPLLFGLLQLVLHGRRGVTAGKAAMRLRSIAAADLGPAGIWHVVLRALVLWASGIVPLVGPALMFASGLWDPQGRSILDRVGGCWVIDARAGLDPFDAKALRHARRAAAGRPEQSEELPSMASDADAASALRIPGARSRAGVVGPGSTGAQWEAVADGIDASVIAQVPGGAAAAHAATGLVTAAPGAAPASPTVAPAAAAPSGDSARTPVPASAPGDVPRPAASAPTPPVSGDSPRTATPAAPTAAPGTGPVGSRRAQAMVRFDDGSIVRVPARGLIGRDPEPAAGEQVEALVRLEDPQRLMSKTHAAFGQDADGLWVADRGSRNGTQLVSPGGDVVDVPADRAARVPIGWSVQVGGRSFELVARGADS